MHDACLDVCFLYSGGSGEREGREGGLSAGLSPCVCELFARANRCVLG